MSDDVLQHKVQDLLEKLERVFHTEWRKTKLNLDHEMIEHFIDPKGTFLHPEGPNTLIPWASRDELIVSIKNLQAELEGHPTVQNKIEADTQPTSYAEAINEKEAPIERRTSQADVEIAQPEKPSEVYTEKVDQVTGSHAIPKPKLGDGAIPSQGIAQWPGPMTAPVAISPAGVQGFPNPFAKAVVENENPTQTEAHQEDIENHDEPITQQVADAKAKFAHLLEGVKYEIIRDFILAEGTNSGTNKPTIIIHTSECIWMEFAFPYQEGQRILNKYPQRDPELIDFMKSSGHVS